MPGAACLVMKASRSFKAEFLVTIGSPMALAAQGTYCEGTVTLFNDFHNCTAIFGFVVVVVEGLQAKNSLRKARERIPNLITCTTLGLIIREASIREAPRPVVKKSISCHNG